MKKSIIECKNKFSHAKKILFWFNITIMQISPVSMQYYSNTRNSAQVSCGMKLPRLNCKKLDGLTYDKYKDLSFLDKLKFRLFTPLSIRRDARANFYAARSARRYLDDKCGRDNYTVMVVGRSLASIGETMRDLGRDVRFLPMSQLADGMPKNINNVEVYKKYLDSIGLTKELIEANPKHHFVLIDYVSSGESLRNAHKFLSRPDLLGNPERIEMVPSQLLVGNNIMSSGLELLYMFHGLKKYSPVSQLGLEELGKTFDRIQPDPLYKNKRNLFLFNIMRKIERYRKKTGKE
ncbi:MAG: hypothetical protein NC390_00365 [Fusobacterium sp.]|nr:hypothetical protein [Fusobacterium sp.]